MSAGWTEVNRRMVGTVLVVTARSGNRVVTAQFASEAEVDSYDWEADFKFAFKKAQAGKRVWQ